MIAAITATSSVGYIRLSVLLGSGGGRLFGTAFLT